MIFIRANPKIIQGVKAVGMEKYLNCDGFK